MATEHRHPATGLHEEGPAGRSCRELNCRGLGPGYESWGTTVSLGEGMLRSGGCGKRAVASTHRRTQRARSGTDQTRPPSLGSLFANSPAVASSGVSATHTSRFVPSPCQQIDLRRVSCAWHGDPPQCPESQEYRCSDVSIQPRESHAISDKDRPGDGRRHRNRTGNRSGTCRSGLPGGHFWPPRRGAA